MGYYVYKFLDHEKDVVYVGRTTNLRQRFNQHEHLSDNIAEIQYIKCDSEADMLWKEIYYINYYHNSKTTNSSDLAKNSVTDLNLSDIWSKYKCFNDNEDEIITSLEEYNSIINLPINKNLINIYVLHKRKPVDDGIYDYSKKWITENIKFTKNKLYNYYNNKYKGYSEDIGWTTYRSLFESLKGKGYTKGFNKDGRKYLAYFRNDFYSVHDNRHELTDDQYALANLLQFIWRSAIRDGKHITVYIPSRRMRELLIDWINIIKL